MINHIINKFKKKDFAERFHVSLSLNNCNTFFTYAAEPAMLLSIWIDSEARSACRKEIMMNKRQFPSRFLIMICLGIWMLCGCTAPAFAYESTTLYNGSKGEDVRELQQALIDLGYLSGTADGVFGNNTENAVRRFQRSNKLTVDGLAGRTTRELIKSKSQSISGSSDSSSSYMADSSSSA